MSYWWVAQTECRREDVAARFLQLAGYEIYLPKVFEGRSIKALFPSYLFVARAAQWYRARWSVGVVRLIAHGSGSEPTCIGDDVIDALRQRERGGLVELPPRPGMKPGDPVVIQRGILQGQSGLFAGMRGHERVLVLLQLLGRVELARADIALA